MILSDPITLAHWTYADDVQGAGESLRGALNAAVDRTFGTEEGVQKNQDVARKGEQQIQSGKFSR